MNATAQIITALATLIASLGTVIIGLLNMRQRQADTRKTNEKLEGIHQTTNGLSERNEAIAKKLGVEEGKQQQRDNPT